MEEVGAGSSATGDDAIIYRTVIHMQATYRGKAARKRFIHKSLKDGLEKDAGITRGSAATKIQACVRGHFWRKLVLLLTETNEKRIVARKRWVRRRTHKQPVTWFWGSL